MTHLLTRKLLSTITLALLSFALSAAVARAQDSKIIKVVGNLQGATITRDGATIPITEGMTVQAKDVINTGAGVDVYVQPYLGVVATVKENSHVGLSTVAANDAELDLTAGGNVFAQIEPNKGHKFRVRTPQGVAAAKGTTVLITVTKNSTDSNGVSVSVTTVSQVTVLGGVVTVTPLLANGQLGTPVSVVGGQQTSNGEPTVALSTVANAGDICAAALAAVAVVKESNGLGDSAASQTLLNETAATVVGTGNTAVIAQATAAAAAAAPNQAGAVVTAAITQNTSASGISSASLAATVTNAASQGAGQAAAQSAAAGTTTASAAVDAAAKAASDVAAAATTAVATKAGGGAAGQAAANEAAQSIANAAASGATAGVTSTAISGNPVTGATTGTNGTTIANSAVQGVQTTASPSTVTQAQSTTSPVTSVIPGLNVQVSPGG